MSYRVRLPSPAFLAKAALFAVMRYEVRTSRNDSRSPVRMHSRRASLTSLEFLSSRLANGTCSVKDFVRGFLLVFLDFKT